MKRHEGLYREGERLLTEEEAAEWLNVSLSALRTLRHKPQRRGPPFTKVGGQVRYSPTALRLYLEGNSQDPGERFVLDIERRASKRSA